LTCQNYLLQDNSAIQKLVTGNGDAKPSSANPFVSTNGIGGTSYSGYFNGSSYLSASSNAAFGFGTGDFTVEYWINGTSWASTPNITDFRAGAGASGYSDYVTSAGFPAAWWHDAGRVQSSIAISTNTWNHVAFTRQSGTVRVFVNGVLGGTATAAQDLQASVPCRIGVTINSTNYFTGYLSNFRAIKGIALYTASFSPPASPLTAISGTSFLTCQSTTFIDNSLNAIAITNTGTTLNDTLNPFSGATSLLTAQSTTFIDNSAIAKTITANGDARPRRANPFVDTVTGPTPYDITTYGGSAYFDGTGDYLGVASNAAFAFGTGDFTIECWFLTTSSGVYQRFWWFGDDNDNTNISVGNAVQFGGASQTTITGSTIYTNNWYHFAYVRSSGSGKLYLNGAQVGSTTANSYNSSARTFYIGATGAGANPFFGYISNLRIVKGTAVYTGPFVPPAAPVTAVTGTQLLVNGTNAGIFDNTTINDLETVGSAQVSTSVVKYGTGSISFNGLNSCVYEPSNIVYGYGTGDFTIEFWLRLNSTTTQTIFSNITLSSGLSVAPHIYYSNASGIRYYVNGADRITGSALNINQWYHIAVCRSGTSTKMFIDGVQTGSTYTDTNNYGSSNPLILGDYASPPTLASMLNGYLDDIRVTKGYARYTANFTPPAGPFPNY
jgi:hypothetical protein